MNPNPPPATVDPRLPRVGASVLIFKNETAPPQPAIVVVSYSEHTADLYAIETGCADDLQTCVMRTVIHHRFAQAGAPRWMWPDQYYIAPSSGVDPSAASEAVASG